MQVRVIWILLINHRPLLLAKRRAHIFQGYELRRTRQIEEFKRVVDGSQSINWYILIQVGPIFTVNRAGSLFRTRIIMKIVLHQGQAFGRVSSSENGISLISFLISLVIAWEINASSLSAIHDLFD